LAKAKQTHEWRETGVVMLKPTEHYETYLHDSKRLKVSEVDRV
jgi:hypothetical protein